MDDLYVDPLTFLCSCNYNTNFCRGKSADGIETYGVVLSKGLAIAVCGDTCLRAWSLDEGGAPVAVSTPLSQTIVRPRPPRKC